MSDEVRFSQWLAKNKEITDLDFERLSADTQSKFVKEYIEQKNNEHRERIKDANAKNKKNDADWLLEHQAMPHIKARKEEKYYYVTKNKKDNNHIILLIKVIAFIASIFIGGWLQEITLQPGVYDVYLGLSLVIWSGWTYFSYNALCRLMLCAANIYKF